MNIFRVIALLICSVSFVSAQDIHVSASPCVDEPSQLQMGRCADFQFKQADARLNRIYRKAMQYMSDDFERAKKEGDSTRMEYEQTAINALKNSERAWLSYRDIQCEGAAHQYEGGSMAPMIYSQCLTTLTQHRVEDIKSVYEDGDKKLE